MGGRSTGASSLIAFIAVSNLSLCSVLAAGVFVSGISFLGISAFSKVSFLNLGFISPSSLLIFCKSSVGNFNKCFLPTSMPLPKALNTPNNNGDNTPDATATVAIFFAPVANPASSKPNSFL